MLLLSALDHTQRYHVSNYDRSKKTQDCNISDWNSMHLFSAEFNAPTSLLQNGYQEEMHELDSHFNILLERWLKQVLPRHYVDHVGSGADLVRHELKRRVIEKKHGNQDEDCSSVHENERVAIDLMVPSCFNLWTRIIKVHSDIECPKSRLILLRVQILPLFDKYARVDNRKNIVYYQEQHSYDELTLFSVGVHICCHGSHVVIHCVEERVAYQRIVEDFIFEPFYPLFRLKRQVAHLWAQIKQGNDERNGEDYARDED